MNPQNAAAQLLYKTMGGVIPQPAKEQAMPVQASTSRSLWFLYTHSMIACTSSPQQVRSSGIRLPGAPSLRTGLQVSVVIGGLLT
jgi:hypothetical protein